MTTRLPSTAAVAIVLTLAGCQGSGAFATLQSNLGSIDSQQEALGNKLDEVSAKVDALSAKVDAMPKGGAAAAARPDAKKPDAPKPGRPDPKQTYKVVVADGDHIKGPDTAKITIVEWSDFQCPYCKRVGPTLAELEKAYGDDLRVVFKQNPLSFHNRAMPAALAAEAAGRQGKFWEMHDKLFDNSKDLTDENFETWAGELGLDVQKFEKDMADEALQAKVKQDQAQGMALGARGTPAFFVNGRFLSGAQPVDAFKAVIDEEIEKADKLIAAGTPKNQVYAKVIAAGQTKV